MLLIKTQMTPISTSGPFTEAYLRSPEEDRFILDKLYKSAIELIYTYTNGRCVQDTTFECYYETSDIDECGNLFLNVFPIKSISSIQTLDDEDVATSFTSYRVTLGDSKITFKSAPPTGRIKIMLIAGYSYLPADLDLAVTQLVTYMYENRGDTIDSIPPSIRLLLDPYIQWRFL